MISTLIAPTLHRILTHKRLPQVTVCTIRCNSLTALGTADILFYSPVPGHSLDNPIVYLEGWSMMAKKLTVVRKRPRSRNWLAYLCEALVTSGAMPTWEAATYLTENLFGEKPNPHLLTPATPHEMTRQFLQRLYQPIVEAASRDVTLSSTAIVHLFTDISLTGNSAVLVVLFQGHAKPKQLVLFDAAKAWDLVFSDAEAFNIWAEERYRLLVNALRTALAPMDENMLTAI